MHIKPSLIEQSGHRNVEMAEQLHAGAQQAARGKHFDRLLHTSYSGQP
jgi:hypothetical protein